MLKHEKELIKRMLAMSNGLPPDVVPLSLYEKNKEDSIKHRREGNVLFVKKTHNVNEHTKILINYTKSIVTAPNGSEELAMAYGNRSAFLLHIHKYQECIEDINRALSIINSNQLKLKLICRKVHCLAAVNSRETRDEYEKAVVYIKNDNIDCKTKNDYMNKLKIIMTGIKHSNRKAENQNLSPEIIPSKDIPCASEALTLKYTENFDKQIVATRDIKCGEILVVENAYIMHIRHNESMYLRCSYCSIFTLNGIPCETCSFVNYCSEKCKNKAWEMYHDLECVVGRYYLKNADVHTEAFQIVYFNLKVFIQAVKEAGSIDNLKTLVQRIEERNGTCKSHQTYKKTFHSSYEHLYDVIFTIIVNNFWNQDPDVITEYFNSYNCYHPLDMNAIVSIASSFIYCLASETSIFKEKYKKTYHAMDDDALFSAALLIRHTVFYYITIKGVDHWDVPDLDLMYLLPILPADFVINISQKDALFSFYAMFETSCYPNTEIVLSNETIIIYSQLPIKKGEAITVRNNFPYYVFTKAQRWAFLQTYIGKICRCKACRENWGIIPFEALENFVPLRYLNKFVELKKKCNPKVALNLFKTIANEIETLHDESSMPSTDLIQLRLFMSSLFIQSYVSPKPIFETCKN